MWPAMVAGRAMGVAWSGRWLGSCSLAGGGGGAAGGAGGVGEGDDRGARGCRGGRRGAGRPGSRIWWPGWGTRGVLSSGSGFVGRGRGGDGEPLGLVFWQLVLPPPFESP